MCACRAKVNQARALNSFGRATWAGPWGWLRRRAGQSSCRCCCCCCCCCCLNQPGRCAVLVVRLGLGRGAWSRRVAAPPRRPKQLLLLFLLLFLLLLLRCIALRRKPRIAMAEAADRRLQQKAEAWRLPRVARLATSEGVSSASFLFAEGGEIV